MEEETTCAAEQVEQVEHHRSRICGVCGAISEFENVTITRNICAERFEIRLPLCKKHRSFNPRGSYCNYNIITRNEYGYAST